MSDRVGRTRLAAFAAGLALAAAMTPAFGFEDGGVAYPEGFRAWSTVKAWMIGPDATTFAKDGGLRHFYANPKALEGYRTGVFPVGSVIVDERVALTQANGVFREGERLNINVMVKDPARFSGTDGWGFETFQGALRTSALTPETRAGCHACHMKAKAHDLVFSRVRD